MASGDGVSPDGRDANTSRGWWLEALGRGFVAAVLVLGLGEVLALGVWAFARTGVSLPAALAAGWLEVGAFHHVAIRLEIRDVVTASHSSIVVTVGIALLAATLAAGWLVVHAGREIGRLVGGRAARRALAGAVVGLGYSAPFAAIAPFVEVETAPTGPAAAGGVFRLSLVWWQALVFPLALGVVAGACGALAASPRSERASAVLASAIRALVAAAVLAFAGLFVGGVVQPDGPLALATPTTARYVRAVFDRPALGVVLLGHHIALAPDEAAWVLAPAMGGCDRVTGSVRTDILCYGRFPERVSSTETPISSTQLVRSPFGATRFADAPSGYFLFLLVPAIATVLGGVRAAAGSPSRAEALRRAILGGVAFGVAFGVIAALANVTIGYRSSVAGDLTSGWLAVGPEPLRSTIVALAWGVAGGAVGALVSRRRSTSSRPGSGGTGPG